MTPEEYNTAYKEVWEARVRALGESPHAPENWSELPPEARVRHLMAHYAASWLEDYKHNIDRLCEFTGEERAVMTAFYFGISSKSAANWIERLSPVEQPKEPWQA